MKPAAAGLVLVSGLLAAALAGSAAWMLPGRDADGPPRHDLAAVKMAAGHSLWVQRHELTVTKWNRCHKAGGCARPLATPAGFDPDETPTTMLSHTDAADWLNRAFANALPGRQAGQRPPAP